MGREWKKMSLLDRFHSGQRQDGRKENDRIEDGETACMYKGTMQGIVNKGAFSN